MSIEFCTTYKTLPIDQKDKSASEIVPHVPRGEGWRLMNTTMDGPTIAYTWQRETPENVQPDIDELLTQRVLDL